MAEETENTENVEETAAAPAEVDATEATAVQETAPAGDTPAAPDAPAAEPEPVLTPKQRKARTKAAKSAKRGPGEVLTPEARHEARLAERKVKAGARRTGRAKSREKAKAQAHQAATTPPRPHVEGIQKTQQGVVVSDKAAKTITVRIDVVRRHRRYSKIVRSSQTLHAHDESGDANIGDTVVVRECRPMSRTKRWRLVRVVERAK